MPYPYFWAGYTIQVRAQYTPAAPAVQGVVVLRQDRDLAGEVQLESKAVTVQDRGLGESLQLKERSATLRQDRDVNAELQLKTRRPG